MSSNNRSCFVTTIDLGLAERLKKDLIQQGFTLKVPAYTLFSAQKKDVSCTLYTSGKLTVQGKGKSDFITYYLEPHILHTFPFSHPESLEQQVNYLARIGVDESGKGDFFGPLCIAGVYADELRIKELLKIGVRDSKALNDKVALTMSAQIQSLCPHALVVISPHRYNQLYENFRNLNHLLGWGHATAISDLVTKTECKEVIIDQFANPSVVHNALKRKNRELNLQQRHRAEEDPVVAAASILARASFLTALRALGQRYNIQLPKGASQAVIAAGKNLVSEHGPGVLDHVAKLHFKTKEQVLCSTGY
jgi:ribonuclease HIII